MAVKTFTTGEVLTAADTNTYLANSGLVYITEVTVGTAVSTAVVSSCFSSAFDNYRVTVSAVDCSVSGTDLFIRFDAGGTTNYYSSTYYDLYTGGNTGTSRRNAAASGGIALTGTFDNASVSIDVYSPNLAKRATWAGTWHGDGFQGWCGGQDASTTQHTGLTILPNSGTMTGGKIRVYGYRQA